MLPILRLVRLPNVFTAIADIMMGFLFVQGSLQPVPAFALLTGASAALYMAGMALNDWFDRDIDRALRPTRPIPSGQVTPRFAATLAVGLLVVGVLCAAALGVVRSDETSWLRWRPALVAIGLAITIVLYDGTLKKTLLAPLAMGGCRLLNILLGMSFGALGDGAFGYDASQWAVALGLGTYVAGITWFARDEAQAQHRANLVWGIIVMTAGLALLACFHRFGPFSTGERQLTFRLDFFWPLTVALLGFSTLRRCLIATVQRTPAAIQVAVKQCLLSLIVFDAAVTMATCHGLVWPVILLTLMVPFLWLGKWIGVT